MKSASSHRCQIPSTFCTPSPNATSPWTHKWSASCSRDVPSCWSSQCFHPRWLSLALVPWMRDVYQEIVVIVEMICDDCSHQQSLFLKTWLLVLVDLDGTWWGQVIGKYGNMIQMKLAIQKLGGAQGSEYTSELNFSYLSLAMLVPRWGSRQETGGRQMVMRQVAVDFNGSKIPRSFPYRPWILNNFDIKVVDPRTPPTFPKNVISVAPQPSVPCWQGICGTGPVEQWAKTVPVLDAQSRLSDAIIQWLSWTSLDFQETKWLLLALYNYYIMVLH